MDELLEILEDIRSLLIDIDDKLNSISGDGCTSIDDIGSQIAEMHDMQASALTEVYNKLDDVWNAL